MLRETGLPLSIYYMESETEVVKVEKVKIFKE
ncbi:uncharacterized protein METZ01_LOCUS143705 [marine metagenome]|jgi:hypothetical protein|uniref:Uncharacterized protein n=1 Tax=marine metagenome TaxID=408172 RepID=A0A381ZPF6_9ZZZZ